MVAESTTSHNPATRAARTIRSAYADVDIPEVSITELVLGDAAGSGDRPALIDSVTGRTLTYAQLAGAVRRWRLA